MLPLSKARELAGIAVLDSSNMVVSRHNELQEHVLVIGRIGL